MGEYGWCMYCKGTGEFKDNSVWSLWCFVCTGNAAAAEDLPDEPAIIINLTPGMLLTSTGERLRFRNSDFYMMNRTSLPKAGQLVFFVRKSWAKTDDDHNQVLQVHTEDIHLIRSAYLETIK